MLNNKYVFHETKKYSIFFFFKSFLFWFYAISANITCASLYILINGAIFSGLGIISTRINVAAETLYHLHIYVLPNLIGQRIWPVISDTAVQLLNRPYNITNVDIYINRYRNINLTINQNPQISINDYVILSEDIKSTIKADRAFLAGAVVFAVAFNSLLALKIIPYCVGLLERAVVYA